MKKALIIGAGPAGLSAAYYGSSLDIKVTLYEKDPLEKIPTKPCGEAIPRFVFDYLPKDMSKNFILNHIKRALFYFNGGFIREFKNMPLIDGFIIDKHVFLRELAELASSIGANIIWNKPIRPDSVIKKFSEYDYMIDASGRGVIARKFLNYGNYKLIPVLQAYAKGNSIPDDTIVLWGVDKGYAWVFPRGDEYNIGVGGLYKNVKVLRRILNDIVKHFNLKVVTPIRGSAVSVNGPLKKLSNGKVRVIGEAAGMVMPTTGEGIRFAVASGKLVFDDDFEKVFWREYGWKLRNGARLLKLLLRIKNKYKLGKMTSDETYFEFFEGTYNIKKILSLGIKYILKG